MRTALFTMLYPKAMRYFSSWKESVRGQSTQDFSVTIGLHGMDADAVDVSDMGGVSVECVEGDHVVMLRRELLRSVAQRFDTIVLADADDILLPTRVEAACNGIRNADVYACAMQVVDEDLQSCDMTFPGKRTGTLPDMTHGNMWGCSNTAYRSEFLVQAACFPNDCILADWYMATMADGAGARFAFDNEPAMLYRVRKGAVTNPCEPYGTETLRQASDHVMAHLEMMAKDMSDAQMRTRLQRRRDEVSLFCMAMRSDVLAKQYVQALYDNIPLQGFWWECVAHTMLEDLWKT